MKIKDPLPWLDVQIWCVPTDGEPFRLIAQKPARQGVIRLEKTYDGRYHTTIDHFELRREGYTTVRMPVTMSHTILYIGDVLYVDLSAEVLIEALEHQRWRTKYDLIALPGA